MFKSYLVDDSHLALPLSVVLLHEAADGDAALAEVVAHVGDDAILVPKRITKKLANVLSDHFTNKFINVLLT